MLQIFSTLYPNPSTWGLRRSWWGNLVFFHHLWGWLVDSYSLIKHFSRKWFSRKAKCLRRSFKIRWWQQNIKHIGNKLSGKFLYVTAMKWWSVSWKLKTRSLKTEKQGRVYLHIKIWLHKTCWIPSWKMLRQYHQV